MFPHAVADLGKCDFESSSILILSIIYHEDNLFVIFIKADLLNYP